MSCVDFLMGRVVPNKDPLYFFHLMKNEFSSPSVKVSLKTLFSAVGIYKNRSQPFLLLLISDSMIIVSKGMISLNSHHRVKSIIRRHIKILWRKMFMWYSQTMCRFVSLLSSYLMKGGAGMGCSGVTVEQSESLQYMQLWFVCYPSPNQSVVCHIFFRLQNI